MINTPGAYALFARLGSDGSSALYMDNNISAIGNVVRSGMNRTNVTFEPTQCIWNGGAGGFQAAKLTLSSDLAIEETHESAGFGSVIGNMTIAKVYKVTDFSPVKVPGVANMRIACASVMAEDARRLVEEETRLGWRHLQLSPEMEEARRLAVEDPAGHFEKYYHKPLTRILEDTDEGEWTDEHRAHAEHLPAIRTLYTDTRSSHRDLSATPASNAAEDSYSKQTACINVRSWALDFRGQACYYQVPNTCIFAFRKSPSTLNAIVLPFSNLHYTLWNRIDLLPIAGGSDDKADWADNILGSVATQHSAGWNVHFGFWRQLDALIANTGLGTAVNRCTNPVGFRCASRPAIASSVTSHNSRTHWHAQVWVGHSLGGALAYVARVRFNKGTMNTYATPAVFRNFRNAFSGARTWHEHDPIPYATSYVGKLSCRGTVSRFIDCFCP